MALSPLATEFLKSIGWYPGRKLPLETVQKHILKITNFYSMLPLSTFRSLACFRYNPVRPRKSIQLHKLFRVQRSSISPLHTWHGEVEGNLGFLKKLTGKTWCPVGVGYNQTGFFVSKDSEFLGLNVHWSGWGLYNHYDDWIDMISGNENPKRHDVHLDASIEIPEDCSPSVVPDDYREP